MTFDGFGRIDYLDQYRFIDESSMIIVDPSKPIESHMPYFHLITKT